MKLPAKVIYRTASLKTLKTLRDALSKCPHCRKSKEVKLAWEGVVKQFLFEKRSEDIL